MASVRKPYTRTKPVHRNLPRTDQVEAACFINDLLDGTIQATNYIEVRNPQGRLVRIDYDDPDGNSGSGQGGAGPRGNGIPPVRQ